MKPLACIAVPFALLQGMCSSHAQDFTKLERTLTFEFPKDAQEDGRWVFYADRAEIQPIEKPLVRSIIPQYQFFKVNLTNYLGYHMNEAACLILFNEHRSSAILDAPEWYSGLEKRWMKLLIGAEFGNNDSLLAFVEEFQDLMMVGSSFDCVNTRVDRSKVTFDIANMSATTTGPVSTNYSRVDLWRHFEIELGANNRILSFASTNPSTGDTERVSR